MDKPIKEWPDELLDRFLEIWWKSKPGLYNQYHYEHERKPESMVENLRDQKPGTFEYLWDQIGTEMIKEFFPPRPKRYPKQPPILPVKIGRMESLDYTGWCPYCQQNNLIQVEEGLTTNLEVCSKCHHLIAKQRK